MPKAKLPDKEFCWNSNLAYAIGLLVTDGCLSNDGRHIVMRSSDTEQMENFKKCLGISNKISKTFNDGWAKKQAFRLQFGNVQLYNWLLKIGLFPNKTYTIGKIIIPDEYFFDFLRGHLDGDGSIVTYVDKWNAFKNPKYIYNRLFTRFLSASERHIKWLQSKIFELAKIKGHLKERRPERDFNTTSVWDLKFTKKDSLKLYPLLYPSKDTICLSRKRRKIEDFIKTL
jgi:hypothetical protein